MSQPVNQLNDAHIELKKILYFMVYFECFMTSLNPGFYESKK